MWLRCFVRYFSVFASLFVVLLFSSCTSEGVRGRLVLADSLMNINADSALVVVRGIDPSQLHSNQSRAFYDLLLSQAQYKTYATITSDSVIDEVVDYYERRGPVSSYARALMLHGAILGELGDYQRAMQQLKLSEKLTSPADSMTLGWINIRIAELYRRVYIENDEHIARYKKALSYIEPIEPGNYLVGASLLIIGRLYCLHDRDSSFHYLYRALEHSLTYKNSFTHANYEYLGDTYALDSNYRKSIDYGRQALHTIKNGSNEDLKTIYNSLSRGYANLHKIDSAQHFYNLISADSSAVERVRRQSTLYEINRAKGDYLESLDNYKLSQHIADSILKAARRHDLYRVEKLYEKNIAELHNAELKNKLLTRNVYIVCSLLVFAIFVLAILSLVRRRRSIEQHNRLLIKEVSSISSDNQSILLDKMEQESQLRIAFEKQISSIKELIDLAYRYEGGNTSAFMKHFNNSIKVGLLGGSIWGDLRCFVDSYYYGVITHLTSSRSQLSEEDINIIALCCCGFSYVEITMCMGYTNERSIYNRQQRIARRIGTDMGLKPYIDALIYELRSKNSTNIDS